MKYFYLFIALFFGLSAGVCDADISGKVQAQVKAPAAEKTADKGLKEIDTGDDSGAPVREDYGVDNTMSQSRPYDANTGLPDVVPSDSDGEIR